MALNVTIVTDTATVVRLIRTPWPVVLVEFLLSLGIALYTFIKVLIELWPQASLPSDYQSPSPSSGEMRLNWTFWSFNLTRIVGAIVVMIEARVSGEFIEHSCSVIVLCCGMLISCISVSNKSAGVRCLNFLAAGLCFLSFLLFLVSGGVAGFSGSSTAMITTSYIGCTDYLQSWHENGCASSPSEQTYAPLLMGDIDRLTSWILSACFGVVLLISMGFMILCSTKKSDGRGKLKRRLQIGLPVVILIGGSFCLVAAVIDAQSNTVDFWTCSDSATEWASDLSAWYYPCYADGIVLTGSKSGFLAEWMQSKRDVLRGLFTW